MFTIRSCKPLPWLLCAALLGASGLAAAVPMQTDGAALICLPDGHLGQFGCELPAGQGDSFQRVTGQVRPPDSRPLVAQVTATEVDDEREPAGGVVVLASVAAVLSLSLRRAAA